MIKKVALNMDEQKKYEIIIRLVEGNGNKDRAAIELGVTRRHINRMINGYKSLGKAYFSHENKNRKPATTIPAEDRATILDLYRNKYYDANFTHFSELLEPLEGIKVSTSTVASILEEDFILSPKATRAKKKRLKNSFRINKKRPLQKRRPIYYSLTWLLSKMPILDGLDALISVSCCRWMLHNMNGLAAWSLTCILL